MTDETPIEDRVAAALGLPGKAADGVDGGPVDSEVNSEPVDNGLDELEWDGVKFTAPKGLKDALMRNEDYTLKSQALAEKERAYEHSRELMTRGQMQAQFRESIEAETKELSVIDAYLSESDKINWRAMDVQTMMTTQRELQQVERRRNAIVKAIEDKRGKFNEEFQSNLSQLRAKSRELATKSIPGFSEETEKAITTWAMAEGLTQSEVDSVLLDPRSAKILWKGMQFDKVKAGTTKAVDNAAKAVRPGASVEKMPASVVNKLNFRKAISKEGLTSGQKANLIEQRLSGMFGGKR